MKAFFVISTHLGGAEKSLLDLVKELQKEHLDFIVVTPKSEGPLLDEFNQHGISWRSLDLPSWFLSLSRNRFIEFILKAPLAFMYLPLLFVKIHKFIEDHNIETIHSTGLKFHLLLGFYSLKNKNIKLVIHLRDIISNNILGQLFELIAKNPHVTWLSNSKVTAESIRPIKSQIIYNGFPPMDESEDRGSLKEHLNIPEETPLIGVVGAIARWKGQREFIEMAKDLIHQKLPYHFVIVGSEIYDTGGEKGELVFLKNMVRQLSLDDRIHFLEFQKNIKHIYQSLDILVHSSIHPEPFGRVIVEAMSEGLPVTAANIGGPLEIIEHNKNGLLHEPGNVKSMSENVVFFLSHPEDTRTISENARARSKTFSLDEHVQQMKNVLNTN